MSVITAVDTFDIRFPTSLELDGSDAMNPDPDYSAAYLVIRTDAGDGHEGHGFVFTIGRGNEVEAVAIEALRHHILGRNVEELLGDMGGTWKLLVHDSQLRWLGPEKGVMHMAIGAVVNALWDLKAKRAGLPLWELLSRMSPEEIVALVDFRYLSDALTPEDALGIVRTAEPGRAARRAALLAEGYPAYTTTPGWLGYSDDKLVRLAKEAVADGFGQIKLKVGPRWKTTSGASARPATLWGLISRSPWMRTNAGTSRKRLTGWRIWLPMTLPGLRNPPVRMMSSAMPRLPGRGADPRGHG
ncbi:L-fuconate dehydratase [Arthrobacter sp. Hiyo8]|nr:L-fuconate dehydratase [Arthrobacter sp. Hiyo8]